MPYESTGHETCSQICRIPKLGGFGLITGYNARFCAPTLLEMQNNHRLFACNYLSIKGLAGGDLIFDTSRETGIAWNKFKLIGDRARLNLNLTNAYNVSMLPIVHTQISKYLYNKLESVKETLKEKEKEIVNLKARKKELKQAYNVRASNISQTRHTKHNVNTYLTHTLHSGLGYG